ncbi:MAG: hypothetical protein KJ709_06765 [Nanoarchaeota archaeon]|nr:hypothetical protein [Nanoarchaeota archaeon]
MGAADYKYSVTLEYHLNITGGRYTPYDTSITVVAGLLGISDETKELHSGCISIQDKDTEVGIGQNNNEIYIRISTNNDMEAMLRKFFKTTRQRCLVWRGSDETTIGLAKRIIDEERLTL